MTDQYRKKPVVVEAVQFNPNAEPWHEIGFPQGVRRTHYSEVADLAGGTSGCSRSPEMWDWSVCGVVETLEGRMLVRPGDWIIKGVKGEIYPCKPDIFEATYTRHHQADDATVERAIKMCPEDACGAMCQRCWGRGWIVDVAAIAAMREDR